jgi:hypothetical protein
MITLGVPRSTVIRKAKAKTRLASEQSERVIGLSRLVDQVESLVAESGDPEGFDAAPWSQGWLEQPNPALGERHPGEFRIRRVPASRDTTRSLCVTVAVCRIVTEAPNYPADDVTGAGAKDAGGRWNRRGTPLLYCTSSIALACLEAFVHHGADRVAAQSVAGPPGCAG